MNALLAIRAGAQADIFPNEPIYYFGSVGDGHYMYDWSGRVVSWKFYKDVQPWGYKLDGSLTPPDSCGKIAEQGLAAGHHRDGWTCISFNDYSGDSRPGSNSAFLIHADIDYGELLFRAVRLFPWFWSRIDFNVSVFDMGPF